MRRHHISSSGSSSLLLFSIRWNGDEMSYDFTKFMYTDNCIFGDLVNNAYSVYTSSTAPSSNGLGYIVDNYGNNPLWLFLGIDLKNLTGMTEDANGNAINNNYVYIYSALATDYIGTFCFPIYTLTNAFNYVEYYDTVDATLNYTIYIEGGGSEDGGSESGGEDEGSSSGNEGGSSSGGGEGGEAETEVPLEEAEAETEVPYEGEGGSGGDESGEGEEPSEEEQE